MPSARPAPISKIAANHENAVTSGAWWAPVNASLNALQCGSRCAAENPIALANPMPTANAGAQRCRAEDQHER